MVTEYTDKQIAKEARRAIKEVVNPCETGKLADRKYDSWSLCIDSSGVILRAWYRQGANRFALNIAI